MLLPPAVQELVRVFDDALPGYLQHLDEAERQRVMDEMFVPQAEGMAELLNNYGIDLADEEQRSYFLTLMAVFATWVDGHIAINCGSNPGHAQQHVTTAVADLGYTVAVMLGLVE